MREYDYFAEMMMIFMNQINWSTEIRMIAFVEIAGLLFCTLCGNINFFISSYTPITELNILISQDCNCQLR